MGHASFFCLPPILPLGGVLVPVDQVHLPSSGHFVGEENWPTSDLTNQESEASNLTTVQAPIRFNEQRARDKRHNSDAEECSHHGWTSEVCHLSCG
jgi:hypothetical protein